MPKSAPASQAPLARPLAVRWRVLLSALIAFHLGAVFVSPWAVPPSSQLSRDTYAIFEPYINAVYLRHGYRFFAPAPGPSHLIGYELTFADGARREGRFPDLQDQWPR